MVLPTSLYMAGFAIGISPNFKSNTQRVQLTFVRSYSFWALERVFRAKAGPYYYLLHLSHIHHGMCISADLSSASYFPILLWIRRLSTKCHIGWSILWHLWRSPPAWISNVLVYVCNNIPTSARTHYLGLHFNHYLEMDFLGRPSHRGTWFSASGYHVWDICSSFAIEEWEFWRQKRYFRPEESGSPSRWRFILF